ncbi:hypothetical protein CRG98_043402 [Punica granatum]|uniref:Uncharacterized protein n=1 Tax=Punica granatum TaxID=22663 RepID=A0A2I0HY67_PUNGR|nr:hypothetical protein CRG98_043402 [Punica granatum]
MIQLNLAQWAMVGLTCTGPLSSTAGSGRGGKARPFDRPHRQTLGLERAGQRKAFIRPGPMDSSPCLITLMPPLRLQARAAELGEGGGHISL